MAKKTVVMTLELKEDDAVLTRKPGRDIAIPIQIGQSTLASNAQIIIRKTAKAGLHVVIERFVGRTDNCPTGFVYEANVRLDRPAIYHITERWEGDTRRYYGYRVKDPNEEPDLIRRKVLEVWKTTKTIKTDVREDWGEVLELPDLIADMRIEEGRFELEQFLTDGRAQLVQQFDRHRHDRVFDATYVIVALRHAPHHAVMTRGISRVYMKPNADLSAVLHAIESTDDTRYSYQAYC